MKKKRVKWEIFNTDNEKNENGWYAFGFTAVGSLSTVNKMCIAHNIKSVCFPGQTKYQQSFNLCEKFLRLCSYRMFCGMIAAGA